MLELINDTLSYNNDPTLILCLFSAVGGRLEVRRPRHRPHPSLDLHRRGGGRHGGHLHQSASLLGEQGHPPRHQLPGPHRAQESNVRRDPRRDEVISDGAN